MEKVSFWDCFLGTKKASTMEQKPSKSVDSTQPQLDGSLREIINKHKDSFERKERAARDAANRRLEYEKQREEDYVSGILENFLASARSKILKASSRAKNSLSIVIPVKNLDKYALARLRAYKALETFCSKYGLGVTILPGDQGSDYKAPIFIMKGHGRYDTHKVYITW